MPGLRQVAFGCLHVWFLLSRGVTLGVRAVVLDRDGRVLLVRHTYLPGWHLPGGGVEVGETALDALARELREEAAIELDGPAALHGAFWNDRVSRRDHVLVFVVRAFRQTGPKHADREIAEAGFFSPDALPEETTRATRARLREIAAGSSPSALWADGPGPDR